MSKQSKYPSRHGEPWGQGEINTLKSRVKKGIDISFIAAKHKRSEFAIKCAIARHCPKMEPISAERLVINGRDYDKILSVAMDNLTSGIFLNAEVSAACQGIPGNITKLN